MAALNGSTALVFFDIDGTLLDERREVPASAATAIRQLRKNGHLAFLNTGRSRACIHPHILEVGFDGIVAACGSYIEFQEQVLLNRTISPEILTELLPLAAANKVDILFEGPRYIYLEHRNQQGDMRRYEEFYSDLPDVIRVWGGYSFEEIHGNKMCYTLRPDSRLEPVLALMRLHFDVIDHAPDPLVEVLQTGFTKATGMQFLLDHLNMPKERTYAFGDSLNDLDMLRFAETGIAMGGSRTRVIRASDHVTGAAGEDGIADALKHFGLI